MSRRFTPSRERVPYLTDRAIEDDAQALLEEWWDQGNEVVVPVPLDDLVELHLGLTYEIEDLRARFGQLDVLGAVWFSENIIRVDSSLDPSVHPSMLGRFNFTLAHEIAHWRLHRRHLLEDPNEAGLFEPNGKPAFVCRSSLKPREEWQADHFAGSLMMPRKQLRLAWEDWRGTDQPVQVGEVTGRSSGGRPQPEVEQGAIEQFCRPLAEQFAVSGQAMRIRLEGLGLLVERTEPSLFQHD
ncbi:MAG: ImmA/IrrE family metallo-endopeptidase [Phycisphaerales bacterium]|nr:ImmA/IrrE family metallo-endopeptidase [Phycisphaerales bacterium]